MPASEDFWDDLLGHLKEGLLLPIVGPEMLTVQSADGTPGPLMKEVAARLDARYSLGTGAGAEFDAVVRAFMQQRGAQESERLYRVVNDILDQIDAPPGEALRALASVRDLRLFVSTSFDSMLARALDAERFGGARQTRELWFAPNQSTLEQQANAPAPAAGETVVFKLFGQASSMPQYALHDEDVLEWLHALLSGTARLPDWLGAKLRDSPLLFLGCRTPDWLGRFMLRMASNARLSLSAKQFFIVGSGIGSQPALTDFFRTYCGTTRVQVLEADANSFAIELAARWKARTPEAAGTPAAAESAAEHGSIFISYAREDIDAARCLAGAIRELGGDVWLDERRLQPGDRWHDEILRGIRREARLFLPLISKNTEAREEGFVFREWAEAVERAQGIPRRRFILPLVVDADYDGHFERYRQVPAEFATFNASHAPGGKADAALQAVLTAEIRSMRRAEFA
ncbi:MAG: toll/interleukin-1 receptor domain-containing protein [Rhodocyclaceae bacterium]|nr:toll/interleukin-1 receptor domain-containing protein [Rhodocyclaceae bacterium]